jgi:hypothetical protein
MPHAIAIAAEYPESMHALLFEELGWRIGDDESLQVNRWKELNTGIPRPAQCSFAEGMIRGRILWLLGQEAPWWIRVKTFHRDMPGRCQSHLESGIAEALLIAVGDRLEARETELRRLPQGTIRSNVGRLMSERIRSTDRIKQPRAGPNTGSSIDTTVTH